MHCKRNKYYYYLLLLPILDLQGQIRCVFRAKGIHCITQNTSRQFLNCYMRPKVAPKPPAYWVLCLGEETFKIFKHRCMASDAELRRKILYEKVYKSIIPQSDTSNLNFLCEFNIKLPYQSIHPLPIHCILYRLKEYVNSCHILSHN